jgi:hypothetical protein
MALYPSSGAQLGLYDPIYRLVSETSSSSGPRMSQCGLWNVELGVLGPWRIGISTSFAMSETIWRGHRIFK